MKTKKEIESWIEHICWLLSNAYEAYQKLIAIEKNFGLNKLSDTVAWEFGVGFQFYDNLLSLSNNAFNDLLFGICHVYDNDSDSTTLRNVLVAIKDNDELNEGFSIDFDKEISEIDEIVAYKTRRPIYDLLSKIRNNQVAHSDKSFIPREIRISEIKKFLDETIERANRIFKNINMKVPMIDFEKSNIKNPIDDFFDKYKNEIELLEIN